MKTGIAATCGAIAGSVATLPLMMMFMGRPSEPPPQRAAPVVSADPAPQVAQARGVADERLRQRLRIVGEMRQRAVQVWPQALSNSIAVCGQVSAGGQGGDPFIPYVAVVSFEGGQGRVQDFVLGTSQLEAGRVYVEMLDRCFAGGGPATARAQARVTPPLPGDIVGARAAMLAPDAPVVAAPPAPAPAVVAGSTAASGTVMTSTRHPVNVRSGPQGGTEIMRVVPRSSSLQVFATAPGGWMQVGESEPWGWVHSSVLER